MAAAAKTSSPEISASLIDVALHRIAVLNDWMSAVEARGGGYSGRETHLGARDMPRELGYPREPGWKEYAAWWKRDPIARRGIELPLSLTWSSKLTLRSDDVEEPESDEFHQAVEHLKKSVDLIKHWQRCDRFTMIGGSALLFLGLSGGEALEQDPGEGKRELWYLRSLSPGRYKVTKWEEDKRSPRYGHPSEYEATFAHTKQPTRVHWRRVVHIASEGLDSDFSGNSIMESAIDSLIEGLKVSGGAAEMFWKSGMRTMIGTVDPDVGFGPAELQAVDEQMRKLGNRLQSYLVGQGIEFQSIAGESPEPEDAWSVVAAKLAAAFNVPVRILFGSERGELASSQDRENLKDTAVERRDDHATPNVIAPTIERLQTFGVLPPVADDRWSPAWPDLYALGPRELQEVNKLRSETLRNLTQPGIESLVTLDEQRELAQFGEWQGDRPTLVSQVEE